MGGAYFTANEKVSLKPEQSLIEYLNTTGKWKECKTMMKKMQKNGRKTLKFVITLTYSREQSFIIIVSYEYYVICKI